MARGGRVAAANPGADRLFGLALAGRHHVAALRQPDILDAIAGAIDGARRSTVRYLAREGARDTVYVVTVAPVGQGATPGTAPQALVLFEDATPVEAAGRMRRDFVANVSHELKTPLTAVLGFIETLRTSARDDAVARERFLTIMEREAQRMNRLVSDLLSLSRVEDEERIRPRQRVALVPLVRRTLSTLKATVESSGAQIELRGMDQPVEVVGDDDQLQQVLANLIENAIKYGRPGGPVTIELAAPAVEPMLGVMAARITVADEGEGIDPVHLPRLTERFYRVDTHRSRASGGTGLGLAIVKHIVSRHRGRLKIESTPGQGSRFSVCLPVVAEDATAQ